MLKSKELEFNSRKSIFSRGIDVNPPTKATNH